MKKYCSNCLYSLNPAIDYHCKKCDSQSEWKEKRLNRKTVEQRKERILKRLHETDPKKMIDAFSVGLLLYEIRVLDYFLGLSDIEPNDLIE